MPSARETTLSGEPCRASDPGLAAAHLRAQLVLARDNATSPAAPDLRTSLLAELMSNPARPRARGPALTRP